MITRIKKYIHILLIPVLALASCGDEKDWFSPDPVNSDGVVEVSFSIPAVKTMSTRTVDEDGGDEVAALIFDKDNDDALLRQILRFTSSAADIADYDGLVTAESVDGKTKYKLTIHLSKELIGKNDLVFYFVANHDCSGFEVGAATLEDVKKEICNDIPSDDGVMTMSGKSLGVKSLLEEEVLLIRSSAKVSVYKYGEESFSYPFSVYGAAVSASILAGVNNILGDKVEVDIENGITEVSDEAIRYIWPTQVGTDPLFIIIKGDFRGEEYYYKLNLVKENDEGVKSNVRIDPNHWYKVEIRSIHSPGYMTAAEAAKHPAANEDIDYKIYDHSPDIYNMITDGLRELGVTHSIIKNDNDGNDTDEKALFIKYYSKIYGEQDDPDNLPVIVESPDWITFSAPVYYTPTDELEYPEGFDTRGRMVKYGVTFDSDNFLGTLEGIIVTEWKGLRRETIVRWEREFKPGDLCTAKLTIYKGTTVNTAVIDDYWTFIDCDGTLNQESGDTPILYGLSTYANKGNVRDEGLHFPLLYGEKGKRWEYSYDIDFSSLKEREDFDWTVRTEGLSLDVSPQQGSHVEGASDVKIKVSRKESDDYLYTTGKLIMEITPKNGGNKSRISFNTYHTGFFHYDVQNHRNDKKDPAGYYYYEVAKIGSRYWLDRNLGAKSARMYIMSADFDSDYGDPDAKGGYYDIANYPGNYEDPKLYDDTEVDGRVSPPGYCIPSQSEWDELRKSSRFLTEATSGVSQSYYTSYYETGLPIGNIYFPKSRFTQNTPAETMGESLTGYFWTTTPAIGTEKEEIGRWLKTLVISGEATSYINGNVETYHIPVRCINKDDNVAEIKHTYFNVKGATHIYLYKGEGHNKTPTTSWPGHAVANYNTADQWSFFTYQSSMFDITELKVIFNHVDEKGIITTIGKIGNMGPLDNEGWKVKGETGLTPYSPSDIGGWWICDFDNGKVSFSSVKPN